MPRGVYDRTSAAPRRGPGRPPKSFVKIKTESTYGTAPGDQEVDNAIQTLKRVIARGELALSEVRKLAQLYASGSGPLVLKVPPGTSGRERSEKPGESAGDLSEGSES